MEDQEKLFIKGFNNGYLLAEHEPQLAAQHVRNSNSHSQYFKGIVSGKQEFDMEKIKKRIKKLPQNKTHEKSQTKGIEKK